MHMEIKVDVMCEFCGGSLDYKVSGDIPKISVHVEPCSRCTNEAMSKAWSIVKKQLDPDGE